MRVMCFLVLFFLPFTMVFSQDIEEITLKYQDEIEAWLVQNDIRGQTRTQRFYISDIFSRPYIHPKYPEAKVYGRGGSVIDCFAVGKFLTVAESRMIYRWAYGVVPDTAKRRFEPFESLEKFSDSLIFSPSTLFGSPENSGLNKDFEEDMAFLIFYFGRAGSRFPDVVFNVQSRQVESGNGKKMLILPYSFNYALFRVGVRGGISLVGYYGVN